jgi:GT2 family glycosyltransferase
LHHAQAFLMAADEHRADGLAYVLLPVHNRRQVTEQFVRCLLQQTDNRFHLVLIDDGSSDGTAEMVGQCVAPLTVISGRGDWWWAGSLQQAYLWLRSLPDGDGDIVLIMNDDTRFGPEFLAAGRAALAGTPKTLLLAQLYGGSAGEFREAGVKVDWRRLQFTVPRDAAEVNCFSTRGLFLRLADFLELGGFHPRLLPHYASDYEFSMRARRRGYRLRSDPAVRLWFDEASTGDRSLEDATWRDFLARSLSPRHVLNPLHWSSFILLACPPLWIPLNLARVWTRYLRQAGSAALRGFNSRS